MTKGKVRLEGGIQGTIEGEVRKGTKISAGHHADVATDAAPVYEVTEVREDSDGGQVATVERSTRSDA